MWKLIMVGCITLLVQHRMLCSCNFAARGKVSHFRALKLQNFFNRTIIDDMFISRIILNNYERSLKIYFHKKIFTQENNFNIIRASRNLCAQINRKLESLADGAFFSVFKVLRHQVHQEGITDRFWDLIITSAFRI
eukprot:EC095821.1.p2 GENE.EC095821.1~~EC095821.1.p2  ORF type:complete len:136 (+),score=1.00 EC095821.1:152-559(+)